MNHRRQTNKLIRSNHLGNDQRQRGFCFGTWLEGFSGIDENDRLKRENLKLTYRTAIQNC